VAFLSDRDGPLDVWLTQWFGQLLETDSGEPPAVDETGREMSVSLATDRKSGWRRAPSAAWDHADDERTAEALPADRRLAGAWSSDGARMVYHTDAPETRCSSRIVPVSAPDRFSSIRL
jgi:hypothetical protein